MYKHPLQTTLSPYFVMDTLQYMHLVESLVKCYKCKSNVGIVNMKEESGVLIYNCVAEYIAAKPEVKCIIAKDVNILTLL
jgi:hypothetical protein